MWRGSGGFDDPYARGEDLAAVVVGGPQRRGVAFCGCEGREGVDVDAGADEEDALDGVGGGGGGGGHYGWEGGGEGWGDKA